MKLKALRRKLQLLIRGLGFVCLLLFLAYLNRPSDKSVPAQLPAKQAPESLDSRARSDSNEPTYQKHSAAKNNPKVLTSEPHGSTLVFSLGHPQSFDEAKRTLRRLFPSGSDIYCGCSYSFRQEKSVDLNSCGLKKGSERRERIEWEHVVPASLFGKEFTAWTQGDPLCQKTRKTLRGRNCAREASSDFRRMEADLYNLLPAVGELNQARSDLAYGDVPGEPRRFGPCDFEIKDKKVEPPASVQGDVARIYFYMQARYPAFRFVHPANRPMFERWAAADPLDKEERDRHAQIEAIQGNSFYIGPLASLRDTSDSSLETVQSKL